MYVCSNCEAAFDEAPKLPVTPQTIFLSYAHKSEREEDFDVSEELVLLIKAELVKDHHTVWIDKEGIRGGDNWREAITAAILGHVHFLSFLSRRSVRDPGVCLNEIAIALGSRRNIQTVLTQAEREVAAPLTISHRQWHDFQDWREIHNGTKTGANGENWDTWFKQRMAQVRETIGTAQSGRATGELQRLKDILVPSEFEARIIEKTQGFFGRQWLFEATQAWLNKSSSRMFWLKGSPGIGKSAFAAKLTHQSNSAVIGFFMCDFQGKKDPEKSAREAICTLAYQIASRLPDYRKKLIYQQLVDKEKVLKKSADDLFEYLITGPLNKSEKISEATRLCLVIDGLDEAGRSDHGNALAELIAKHVDLLPAWLGIIVTSRPEPYLEQLLKPLSSISVNGQTDQNRLDLMAWIGERLPAQLQGEERQRILDAVIDKSGGTFLYLRLVDEDKTLDFCKPETLPDKLDGIFKQNFKRYFPDAQEYGNKTEPFLRLLVAAPGPLPAQMGREILDWNQRDLTLKVIGPLGSLLQERDGGLVFFHASLSEWLKDPKRSGTHCVNDTGGNELGEFLWIQYENFTDTKWKEPVVLWLATLLPHTDHWDMVKDLNRVAEFLTLQLRHRDAIAVQFRELERIKKTVNAKGLEAAECMRSLSDGLQLIGDSAGAMEQIKAEQAIRERLTTQEPDNASFQNNLGVSYDRMGGILQAQGDLTGALAEFSKSLAISERLAAKDLDNAGRQRELGVSYDRMGVILLTHGDLTGALAVFRKSLAISERLAAKDSYHEVWQHDLGASYSRMGDFLKVQGDLAGALAEYRKSLAISERLASKDPDNEVWQHALGKYYARVGGILEDQGDRALALAEFSKSLVINERVAAQDPDNAGWQHDLGECYDRVGGILAFLGDLAGALAEFSKSLAISERLAAKDPYNAVWQRNGVLRCSRMGGILAVQGDLPGALAEFRKSLAISERLAAQDPDNAGWQRDLAFTYYRMGVILRTQDDLPGALEEFSKTLAISERLAAQDPDNADWQRDLGLSYHRMGDILETQGDMTGALAEFSKSLAISERHAAQEPDNANWQRDLVLSYSRMGNILNVQGDLAGALAEFSKSLAICERLVAIDPDNAGWQSDLGMSYARMGGILEAQGDLAGALAEFNKSLAICEHLEAIDPDNATFQHNLCVSYDSVGGILEAQGKMTGALSKFRKRLAILERLAAQDPGNAFWQRELGVIHSRLGSVLESQGDKSAAQTEFASSLMLFEKLRNADTPGSMIDYAAANVYMANCKEKAGLADHSYDVRLAEMDWTADSIVGAFHMKSIPKIVARLNAIFDRCDPTLQSSIARRCLASLEAIGVTDLDTWRARVDASNHFPPAQ
jgi:tetratricopeptide (TPR) repeat protein